jgi:hypothetical protein
VSPSEGVGLAPEQQARAEIDWLLTAAGRNVCEPKQANIYPSRSVAIREFSLAKGYCFPEHLLCVDAGTARVIEAKRQCATLSVEETPPTDHVDPDLRLRVCDSRSSIRTA